MLHTQDELLNYLRQMPKRTFLSFKYVVEAYNAKHYDSYKLDILTLLSIHLTYNGEITFSTGLTELEHAVRQYLSDKGLDALCQLENRNLGDIDTLDSIKVSVLDDVLNTFEYMYTAHQDSYISFTLTLELIYTMFYSTNALLTPAHL